MTLEQKKKELLALLPQRQVVKPATYDDIKKALSTLVYEYIEDKPLAEAPAAATRSPTGIYQIILPKDIPEYGRIPLDLHENGHCIFQHLKDSETKINNVIRQLRGKWAAFKAKIEKDQDFDDEDMLRSFALKISNVAMDCEINSKYFGGGDDWKTQTENISVAIVATTIMRAKEISDEKFKALKKELSNTEAVLHHSEGVHPEMFKFPLGLNWAAYINLILLNPNEFMDNMSKQMNEQKEIEKMLEQLKDMIKNQKQDGSNQQGQGQGQSQGKGKKQEKGESNGNSKDKNGQKKEKKDDSGNRKIKASEIKNAQEKQAKISDEAKEVAKKATQEKAAEKAASEKDDGSGDDDWSQSHDDGDEVGIGTGHLTNRSSLETNYVLDRNVRSFIEKCCLGNAVTYEKQDPLYNFNRGKCGHDGVMRMRTSVQQVYRPGNLIAVIDVSGSVNIELVKALLNELKKYRSNFGYRSRVILWDTDLVEDLSFKEIKEICGGGGTDIALGINYAKKYLKSDADKLFIISDFEDYLDRWVREISTLRSDVFGICWGGSDGKSALQSACNRKNLKIERMKIMNVN